MTPHRNYIGRNAFGLSVIDTIHPEGSWVYSWGSVWGRWAVCSGWHISWTFAEVLNMTILIKYMPFCCWYILHFYLMNHHHQRERLCHKHLKETEQTLSLCVSRSVLYMCFLSLRKLFYPWVIEPFLKVSSSHRRKNPWYGPSDTERKQRGLLGFSVICQLQLHQIWGTVVWQDGRR